MKKTLTNFFYRILIKSAENYYGESLKHFTESYTPHF